MKTGTDKKLYERLVKENMKRAYFSALGILGSHDDAMEVSQEAFLRAYKSFGSYDKNRKFFTWYYKILRNLCLNFIRDKKNRKETPFVEYMEYKNNDDMFDGIETEEMKVLLSLVMTELTPEEREIIHLKEFENYSYKEISEMLGIPVGTVMSKLHYTRKKLAVKLKVKL